MELKKYKKKRITPQGWKEVTLADAFNTSSGATPLSTEASYYENGTIPWINSGELASPYIYGTTNFISQAGFENSSTEIYPIDTVLVAMYGATAGKASLLKMEACTNQAICAILPNKDYSSTFLKYSIDTLYDHLVGLSSGSARDNLSQAELKKLKLIMPPTKDEQNKLVSILALIDRKIELNRAINQNLEAMAKQLYDYWFVQFDFPNENGRPYKSFGGKMVWNEKQRKYIPEYWEVKSLSNWLEIKSGFPFKSETYKPIGRYKIITIKNVQDGELVTSGCDYVNDIPSRAKDYISLQIGDRLISLTGNCGRLCVVCEENLLLNQRVGLLCCDAIYLEYFYNFLNSGTMRTVIDNLANGAAQANLSPVELCKTDCFIPPIDILLSYNRKVNAIRKAIVQNNQEISQLAKQRDELLPLLMNGQVSVNSDLSVYKKRRGKVPSSIQNDVSDI